MAKTIDQAYINTFESNIRHKAQQGMSKLRSWVEERHEQSEAHNWETLDDQDDADMRTKGTGLEDTPDFDEVWAKRRTNIVTFDTGNSVQQDDIVQMLVDPKSALVTRQAKAMNRKTDDIIIAAAFAAASIKGAGTPVTFPIGQEIGDYSTELTFDFATQVTQLFLENEIEQDVEKVIFISPVQARALLHATQATSADYVQVKALATIGIVENWMGYMWIVSNRLNAPLATQLDCIAMTREALGLHIAADISTQVAVDPSKSFAWRVYSKLSMDCVRVQDEQIIKMKIKDTFTPA